MDFDLRWLLSACRIAFALGWLASRLDLRAVPNRDQQVPKAYFKGLNLLLNEQQDKAIDAFIEAVQHDPTPPSCTSRSATCSAAAASTSARCACTSTCWRAPTCRRTSATAPSTRWRRTT